MDDNTVKMIVYTVIITKKVIIVLKKQSHFNIILHTVIKDGAGEHGGGRRALRV